MSIAGPETSESVVAAVGVILKDDNTVVGAVIPASDEDAVGVKA